LNNFVNWMEKYFIPVASKIGAQRHFVAIRDSFMVTMPLMIIGTLGAMLNNLPIDAFNEFMNRLFGGETWKAFGVKVWDGTFGVLSVIIVFLVAYHLARSYGKDSISAGIVSLGSFFALGGAKGMSAKGLFVALLVSVVSCEMYIRFSSNERLVVKMPEGVPPAVSKSLAILFPAMVVIGFFGLVAAVSSRFGVTDIIGSFYESVQQPFMAIANTYPSALLLAFITPFVWFFGLHGSGLVEPLVQMINAPTIEANVKAIEAGETAPYIVNKPFIDSFVNLGGTGATLGLIIAVFLVGRNSDAFMMINKLSFGSGIFNINESLLFGLPIVLNPIMFVPFILVPSVLVTVTYLAMVSGLVPAVVVMPPWTVPPILSGIIATKSLMGGVLAAVNLLISIVIYIPFVKMAVMRQEKTVASSE